MLFDSHTFEPNKCHSCPFYDESTGFSWCFWYKQRCSYGSKPNYCEISKIVVEEKNYVRCDG